MADGTVAASPVWAVMVASLMVCRGCEEEEGEQERESVIEVRRSCEAAVHCPTPPPRHLRTSSRRRRATSHLLNSMDQGHYNCRDHYISPHFAPTTHTSDRHPHPLERHESFTELEQRSRSPASQKPKFPLFKLPLELRQEILSYLLPNTQRFRDSGGLAQHVRDFSAVKKRQARGMPVAASPTIVAVGQNNVVWQRGNIDILRVCRQLHDECAELIYGTNTFLLFISYQGISFRFRWLLPSGLAPSRNYPFLELLSERYIRLVKKVSVSVDLVDSYTGMIKYNVSGQGLTHGLKRQVQRLVDALRDDGQEDHRRLSRVSVRVQNGDNFLEARKGDLVRQRDGSLKSDDDVAEMLEPFSDLYGVGNVSVVGAVSADYAQALTELMMDKNRRDEVRKMERGGFEYGRQNVQMCVYGNDIGE